MTAEVPPVPRFAPLPRTDLAQRIAGLLTDAILAGRLRPGERISEAATARELGVSRAPVREAARLLESSGLLHSHPNRGFFVRTMRAADLDEVYELRICIETGAGARLARRAPDAIAIAVAALRGQIEAMRRFSDGPASLGQVEEDLRFHRILCQHSGNSRLLAVFDQVAREVRIGVTLIGRLYDDPALIAATHEPVVAALARADPDAVRAALIHHIDVARLNVVTRLRALEQGQPV